MFFFKSLCIVQLCFYWCMDRKGCCVSSVFLSKTKGLLTVTHWTSVTVHQEIVNLRCSQVFWILDFFSFLKVTLKHYICCIFNLKKIYLIFFLNLQFLFLFLKALILTIYYKWDMKQNRQSYVNGQHRFLGFCFFKYI